MQLLNPELLDPSHRVKGRVLTVEGVGMKRLPHCPGCVDERRQLCGFALEATIAAEALE
jgi:hypothetical protein